MTRRQGTARIAVPLTTILDPYKLAKLTRSVVVGGGLRVWIYVP